MSVLRINGMRQILVDIMRLFFRKRKDFEDWEIFLFYMIWISLAIYLEWTILS
jgi:hypothetical protein